MEFIIRSMPSKFFSSIKVTLPNLNEKKREMDNYLNITIFCNDTPHCIIKNNQSDLGGITSEYDFPIEIIENNQPLFAHETTASIKELICFSVSSLLLISIIKYIETHDLKIKIDEQQITLITNNEIQYAQADLFDNSTPSTYNDFIKFQVPTIPKEMLIANITVPSITLYNHLNHLSQIHPINAKGAKRDENTAYIQYHAKSERLIFYSPYQAGLSTSGFHYSQESDSSDFFLTVSKKSLKKLSTLIKQEVNLSVNLITDNTLPDAKNYYLKIITEQISFSFNVNITENHTALLNDYSKEIASNSEIKEEFNGASWHNSLKQNILNNDKATAIEIFFDELFPDKIKLVFSYEQNLSHKNTSTQTYEINEKMPFSDYLSFKLNLSIFYNMTKTFSDLGKKATDAKSSSTISTEEHEPNTLLFQCNMNSELKERFFVLIPFEKIINLET